MDFEIIYFYVWTKILPFYKLQYRDIKSWNIPHFYRMEIRKTDGAKKMFDKNAKKQIKIYKPFTNFK